MKHTIFLIIISLLFASCKQVEYVTVPVREVHTEYIHDSVTHTDTMYFFNHTFTQGDTVYIRDSVLRIQNHTYYSDRIVRDTVADTSQIKLQAELIDALREYGEKQGKIASEAIADSTRYIRWLFAFIILCLLLSAPWIYKIYIYLKHGK